MHYLILVFPVYGRRRLISHIMEAGCEYSTGDEVEFKLVS